ncbi:hypothetical protein [Aquabacterium sp.]|uniref:hypothetical protein n=1 Tax=Aquabacterium sp. TaxID=1872578 RepID=UPI002C1BD9AC|nr:hypothetical protein [Aquabacterium sp.]HSW03319.1 hypothetical protein [Aquabacterium sp.]
MTNTTESPPLSDVPWPIYKSQVHVPDTALLPEAGHEPPATVDLLKRLVQGAHDTIDSLADSATPALQHLAEGVSGAEAAVHAKTDQLRETGDAWAEILRRAVRDNPLVAVAAALAVGALIARISRSR